MFITLLVDTIFHWSWTSVLSRGSRRRMTVPPQLENDVFANAWPDTGAAGYNISHYSSHNTVTCITVRDRTHAGLPLTLQLCAIVTSDCSCV